MVRAMLIRSLSGTGMMCLDALALEPVASLFDDDRRRLHEWDLSPRPAVAALDLAAGLLNVATPARWLDLPGGARISYWQKDDGRGVAALWRPFGTSETLVHWPDLPAGVDAVDCMGTPLATARSGEPAAIGVNEVIRYLLVPAEVRESFEKSLDSAGSVPH
jgi:hypothetical protein